MAASDSDPLSAEGLAAVLEAGADASGTGGKPVSAGNLKALVDGGKIGAVDVLFRSEAGATSGTLSAPVENYDVVCAVFRHTNGNFYMACANPWAWSVNATQDGSNIRSFQAPRLNGNVFASTGTSSRDQQVFSSGLTMNGNSMSYIRNLSRWPVHLVIGIKTVGGGVLLEFPSQLPEVA